MTKIKTATIAAKSNTLPIIAPTDPVWLWLSSKQLLSGVITNEGKHRIIRCPWKDNHSSNTENNCWYKPPLNTDDEGEFGCTDTQCNKEYLDLINWCVHQGYKPVEEELKYLTVDSLKLLSDNIVTKSGSDVGYCFEDISIATLAHLKNSNNAEWQRIRRLLKKIKHVSITNLDKELSKNIDETKGSEYVDDHDIAMSVIHDIGADNILYVDNTFWKWDNTGIWNATESIAIKKDIHNTLTNTYSHIPRTKQRIASVLDVTRTECYRRNHQFNICKDHINVLNGELNLVAGKWILQQHNKRNYSTIQIPIKYDPYKNAPEFQKFLLDILKYDSQPTEKARLVCQCMGYSLSSNTKYEKFIILVGNGANGKTVLLSVIQALIGIKNCAAVQPSQFNNKFQRAHLQDKLANIVSEFKYGSCIDDDALKSITSGESITVEHKNQNPFKINPFCTCWFGTNHLPHTTDFTNGLFRRAIVIPFNRTYSESEQDKTLKDRLIDELPGILNLALTGLTNLITNNQFIEVKEVEDAKNQWRIENDQVKQFIDDCCTLSSAEQTTSADMYNEYTQWAATNGIYRKIDKNSLSNRLQNHGVRLKKINGERYLIGICIN